MIFNNLLLIVLLICFGIQIIVLRIKVLLHPSFWFFVIWIISVLCFDLITSLNFIKLIYDINILNELFEFVGFTAICFAAISLIRFKKYKKLVIPFNVKVNTNLFNILALVIFAVTLFNFLFYSSFNVVANREALLKYQTEVSVQGSVGPIAFLKNLLLAFNIPLLLIAGQSLGRYFNDRVLHVKSFRFSAFMILPLFSQVIQTISIGGRAGIISAIILMTFGISMGIFASDKGTYKKVWLLTRYALIFVLVFSIYATIVNTVRAKSTGKNSSTIQMALAGNQYLAPFGGVIEYLVDHYPGYQLRRMESNGQPPALGRNTLAGLINPGVPVFSQIAGTDLSINNLLGIGYFNVVKSSQRSADLGLGWARATATVFKNLYDDWGYSGTFFAIAILVFLTQVIFENLFRNNHKTISSFFLMYLCVLFWSQTIFSHIIVSNWFMNTLYCFWAFDLISKYYNQRKKLIQ